ncbi:MAG: hypothetical protein WAW23_13230 [Candidatus Methanoperedens sp.]
MRWGGGAWAGAGEAGFGSFDNNLDRAAPAQSYIPVMAKSNIITINTYLLFNVMILPAIDHGNNSFYI